MSQKPFRIKQGDLLPFLRGTLTGLPSDMVPIPGGTVVRFHMMNLAGTILIDAAGYVVDAVTLRVGYNWALGDTDIAPGVYYGEFELIFGGEPLTFPNDRNFKISIFKEIA